MFGLHVAQLGSVGSDLFLSHSNCQIIALNAPQTANCNCQVPVDVLLFIVSLCSPTSVLHVILPSIMLTLNNDAQYVFYKHFCYHTWKGVG